MSVREVVINPKYIHLSDFVAKVPQVFDSEGECIYHDRNTIKVFQVDGVQVNVKRYCIPKFIFNRFVYRLLRAPKAKRAYKYAIELRRRGFSTPEPIAYIIESSCPAMIGYTYFISVQESYSHDIEEYLDRDDLSVDDLQTLAEFGRYTASLHEAGIYHHDYGGGNILFNFEDGVPRFSLLDINRMDFGSVSQSKGYYNFRLLRFMDSAREAVGVAYAASRGYDENSAAKEVFNGRERHKRRRKIKSLRRYLGLKR